MRWVVVSAAHRMATSPHLDSPQLGQWTVSEKVMSYVYGLYHVRVAIAIRVFSYLKWRSAYSICHEFHEQ